jgi:signal transduction histidine kinase
MTGPRSLSVRARVTAAFAAVMAVLLLALSVVLYRSMSAALLDELDSGLRFRAAAIASPSQGASVEGTNPLLEERAEAFDQLLAANGTVLRSTNGLSPEPLLPAATLRGIRGPTFFERTVPGVQDTARLLAVPVGAGRFLVVGTTMADRTDALNRLLLVLGVAGPVALLLASLAGWFVAGLGLRPVERMRAQAEAINASGLDHRLDLPQARDEVYRLGVTLNALLDRLEDAARSDRRFLERASHELRTPLTALKAELDLAASSAMDLPALRGAVASATEETDRLVRLSNDLLSLARTRDGRMPLSRVPTPVGPLVQAACDAMRARAGQKDVALVVDEAPPCTVVLDPLRVRQALDNLLDNALRHVPPGGSVHVRADRADAVTLLSVRDNGPGFASRLELASLLDVPDLDVATGGLGLRIAAAVARSHGGELVLEEAEPHGALVTLVLRAPGTA